MTIEFKLPEISEGVESVEISEILVSEGDVIDEGQNVLSVETDKAVADIECPHGGRINKIHIKPGDTVPIGALLLSIDEDVAAQGRPSPPDSDADAGEDDKSKSEDEQPQAEETAPATEPSAEPEAPPEPEPEPKPEPEPQRAAESASAGDGEAERSGPDMPHTATTSMTSIARIGDDRDKPPAPAGPSTRRLARQLGVDLDQVDGSGPGGRITADDVKAFVRSLTQRGHGVPADVTAPMAAPSLPDFSRYGPIQRQRMSKLARTSANNLSVAWRVAPHVTQHDLADVTDLEASRRNYMQTVGKGGPKITMTAIVIKAAVVALKHFPHFNASVDTTTNELVLKGYYHIGCAVDTEHGLVVPVIRDADQKSILDIAANLADLAERARDRKLEMDEMQGGTFTITNLGGIGGTAFTPIINYPEVAILGLSRSQKHPKIVDGQLEERLMLPLSLSYDHRVINGADAARFIVKVTQTLSDFMQLMVEA